MPAYGYQIETDDVWSIVHYVRALQRSQNATLEDLPQDEQEKMAKES
jgi:mono/diheme cytochrome c family protein